MVLEGTVKRDTLFVAQKPPMDFGLKAHKLRKSSRNTWIELRCCGGSSLANPPLFLQHPP